MKPEMTNEQIRLHLRDLGLYMAMVYTKIATSSTPEKNLMDWSDYTENINMLAGMIEKEMKP